MIDKLNKFEKPDAKCKLLCGAGLGMGPNGLGFVKSKMKVDKTKAGGADRTSNKRGRDSMEAVVEEEDDLLKGDDEGVEAGDKRKKGAGGASAGLDLGQLPSGMDLGGQELLEDSEDEGRKNNVKKGG